MNCSIPSLSLAKKKIPSLSLSLLFSFFFLLSSACVSASSSSDLLGHQNVIGGRRTLLSFKETPKGSNVSFECSPSGPCIPCQYSEKKNPKYRCSETGYRIPLKCKAPGDGKEAGNDKTPKSDRLALEVHSESDRHIVSHELGDTTSIKARNLLDESSTGNAGLLEYVTYRSCIPAINEEKLSILGFEVIILCLLLASGSFVYFRRKRTMPMPGVAPMRIPTNSRF